MNDKNYLTVSAAEENWMAAAINLLKLLDKAQDVAKRVSYYYSTEHTTTNKLYYSITTRLLGMVDESRSLMESLRKRQKNWIGHVLRHDFLLQKVIEGRFQGKKTPGRPVSYTHLTLPTIYSV